MSKEEKEEDDKEKFVFGSPQKHEFEFKPRSPRRISTGQGDESDGIFLLLALDIYAFRDLQGSLLLSWRLILSTII